jgi:hypothetical protein
VLSTLRAAAEPRTDVRSPEEIEVDRHFGPAAKPEEFVIHYGEDMVLTPEQQKQRDQSVRTWLSEAQFPREIGNSVAAAVLRVEQQNRSMTPEQLESYGVDEFMKLQRVYGEGLDDKLRSVDRMVQGLEVKQPGLVRLLKSAGIMDNALVASLLIQQAERYHARRGAQETR